MALALAWARTSVGVGIVVHTVPHPHSTLGGCCKRYPFSELVEPRLFAEIKIIHNHNPHLHSLPLYGHFRNLWSFCLNGCMNGESHCKMCVDTESTRLRTGFSSWWGS